MKIKGLVAAVFSPMKQNGEVNPDQIKPIMDFLVKQNIQGIYVCGSTGEGPLLTLEERKIISRAYIEAAPENVKVFVQVGDDCLKNSIKLATFAAGLGADGISALPPRYFAPKSVQDLVECIREITTAIPNHPFYYYHLPLLSGVDFNMLELLAIADREIPNFAGIKFTQNRYHEMMNCINYKNGKYQIFHGSDENLVSGLITGAKAAIGSTYNFAPRLYNEIIENFDQGNLEKARELQLLSVQLIDLLISKYRGQPAFKGIMKLIGLDCGPNRLPLKTLSDRELLEMETDLKTCDYMKWIG
ncbi:MAG: dihydrodipicolinate synthase family protein [Candidatus Marinimicrobia bacterium]|nr:dihydrodipicolinate synthase family protein [Candidatus Neomarinimicrobiota bacterium]